MGVDSLLQNKLNSNDAAPLYLQLTAQIKDLIATGEIAVGSLLPSEPELCEGLGISRSTVRQALATLETQGYVVRRRGKGTYASKPKIQRRLSRLCSFTKQMSELGMSSETRVIEFAIVSDDKETAVYGNKGSAYVIKRLRKTQGLPFMIDTVHVPTTIIPQLTKEELAGTSLYDIVEKKTGNVPYRATESYEVVKLSAKQKKTLETDSETAFLVNRVSRLMSGEVFEVASMLIRGDRCKLEAMLTSDAIAFSRSPSFGIE
jgi:GntR family transcriptional regulator